MRLIHTSDWHLGRTLHGADLLSAQAGFLDWLLAESVRQRADAVIVAGDVYDRAVPSTDAVTLLDRALSGFAMAGIPVLLISGNHDSAIRLGFGARLSEAAGIHLRTSVADIARPVLLADEHGEIAMYGLPFLLPDAVMDELGADRSHASVLAAATDLIRADAAERGIARTVVTAHAFVSGAQPTESERDIRVGGVADAPASAFAGFSYVALGHLHGQQDVASPAATDEAGGAAGIGAIRYSGSPLAFSFSERRHAKSVTLAEIDGAGRVRVTQLQGRAHRFGAARGADGAAAGALAAHARARLRPRWRARRLRDRLAGAAAADRPGRDLRPVRGVHQRRAARR
jgi:exonuclease SbcD